MTSAPTGTWAAMSIRSYRLLFYSAAIVIFGVMGQAVAHGWLARELTGSNAGLGGVMLVFGGSMLVATPFGGVAADRYPKRLMLLLSVGALMVSSLAIGLAVAVDVIAYWMLLVASGCRPLPSPSTSGADRIDLGGRPIVVDPERDRPVPDVAGGDARDRASARRRADRCVDVRCRRRLPDRRRGERHRAGAHRPPARLPGRTETSTRSPFGEIADTFAYIRVTPGLGMIALLTVGVVMVAFPYLTFLPTLADEGFDVGAVGYGLMSTAVGIGALTAGLFSARLNKGTRPWRTIAGSSAALGITVVLLGFAGSFALALVALAGIREWSGVPDLLAGADDAHLGPRVPRPVAEPRDPGVQRVRPRGAAVRAVGGCDLAAAPRWRAWVPPC